MDIKEFAQRLGVSTTTVSQALNGKRPVKAETKRLIFEKMQEWGYTPNANARRLVSSKTNLIAFLSDASDTLADPYQLAIIRIFCRLLRERGYDLLLDLYHESGEDCFASLRNRVRSRSIDGSLIISSQLGPNDFEELATASAPCVYIDTQGHGRIKHAVSISVDSRAAYREVFRCLKQIGHSRIGVLARHEKDWLFQFWMEEIPQCGLSLAPGLCEFSAEDVEQARDVALRMLLAEQRPQAIIARTEAQAQGVLRAAQQFGIHVPQELSIVSHGDIFFSRGSEPPLATVSFDYKKLGETAILALFEMIEDPKKVIEPIVLVEQFFPRGSII